MANNLEREIKVKEKISDLNTTQKFDEFDFVFVPNRVANAKYNYTLIQEKIFNYLMFNLQEAIKASMKGAETFQLSLFREINEDKISLDIPLRNITSPDHYNDVRQAAEDLGKSIIRMRVFDKETGQPQIESFLLFGSIVTPAKGSKSSFLIIKMSKEVAKLLVEMDLNEKGKPCNYTSFLLQVALRATNKYTPRIYKMISGWKEKRFFYTSLEDFRDTLQLDGAYLEYKNIKRHILIPAQKELEGTADCWFNCMEDSFEKRKGKKVVGFNWKVITPEFEIDRQNKIENIKTLLTLHFQFKSEDFKKIEPIFSASFNYGRVNDKVMELFLYIRDRKNTKEEVKKPKPFVIKSLLNEFGISSDAKLKN